MRELEFIRDHVTFKLPYDFSYHMKTPNNQHPLHWIYFVAYLVTISNTLLLLFCRCIVTVPSCLLLGILQHQQSMQQPKALKLITRQAKNYEFIAKLFSSNLWSANFSQKTNRRICFVCFFTLHGKQIKFVHSFFGRIYGAKSAFWFYLTFRPGPEFLKLKTGWFWTYRKQFKQKRYKKVAWIQFQHFHFT